ncbi:MAG: hypothetical protein Kow0068_12770 [Marinilabiliales bacterium]
MKEDILKYLDNLLTDSDLFLVDVVAKNNSITVEIDSFISVKIDDCVKINRDIRSFFGEKLDDFDLTVTSSGLNKPFKIINQYIKNINKEVEVTQKDGKKTTGILKEVNKDDILLEYNDKGKKKNDESLKTILIDFKNIKSTKAVIKI